MAKKSVIPVRKMQEVTNRQLHRNLVATLDKAHSKKGLPQASAVTMDSFVNFAQKMGVGADNALSTSSYGFNPITRIRTMLEWIHRGSWLGGVAVDVIAEDMTKMGVELVGDTKPQDVAKIERAALVLQVWPKMKSTIKWARLYGGACAYIMIDGQNPATPLRIESIGPGAFKGLLPLDRWMIDSSMNDIVTELGPDTGEPKYYTINGTAPGLNGQRIHHSRMIKLVGVELPYWQRVMENMWGISVLERMYDRMIAFDSATTGAAQLVYKAYIRTYKVKGMRDVAAAGGQALQGLAMYTEMMRRFQNLEGITLIDGDDEFEGLSNVSFSGLSDALTQFGQQVSGALGIPLTRLFGQSPSGFNSGDSDLRMYYDNIKQKQESEIGVGINKVYRCIAQSEQVKIKDSFEAKFRNLWQLTDDQKADIAGKITTAIRDAEEAGLVSPKVAMEELRQSSRLTGVYTNISDKDINAADEEAVPSAEEATLPEMAASPVEKTGKPKSAEKAAEPAGNAATKKPGAAAVKKPGKAGSKDSAHQTTAQMRWHHDLDLVIENEKGSLRYGGSGATAWEARLPADYGYVRRTEGADGDEVDCFVGPNRESRNVFIINQRDTSTRLFDEHKVMLGYDNFGEAVQDYFAAYTDGLGPVRMASIHYIDVENFKQWLAAGGQHQPYGGMLA